MKSADPKTLLQLMRELDIAFHEETIEAEPDHPPGRGKDARKGWIKGRPAHMVSTFTYQGRSFTTTYIWFKGPLVVAYEPQTEEEYAEVNLKFLLFDAKNFQEFWREHYPQARLPWLKIPYSDSDTYREHLSLLWEMRKFFREELQLLMSAPCSRDYFA